MKEQRLIQSLYILCAAFIPLLSDADSATFSLGPYLKFVTPGTAAMSWQTERPATAVVEIKKGDAVIDTIRTVEPSTDQRVLIQNLEAKTTYTYQIKVQAGDSEIKSPTYEINTNMNYTKYPLPDSLFDRVPENARHIQIAKQILAEAKITKGYCLIYGCKDGRLAYELARQSELTVIGVDEDKTRIQTIRQDLLKKNLYGTRFTFYHVRSLKELPLPAFLANLIVSERILYDNDFMGSASELCRVLRPSGGIAWLGRLKNNSKSFKNGQLEEWLDDVPFSLNRNESNEVKWISFQRPALNGIGSWTHQYGNPSNTANSGDSLGGVSDTGNMGVQWIGRPGADFGIDRNPRMPSPLSVNGRLFHQGLNRLAAIDSYNGTILWTLEIPDLRRVNMPRDASNWCADDNFLYVAIQEQCWKLNAGNGDIERIFSLPQSGIKKTHDWGYIANRDEWIYGSCVKKGSVYTDFFGGASWYDKTSGYGTGKICSDLLFACDKTTGQTVWEYQNGVIINTSITMGDGTVFFVESRNPGLEKIKTSRIEAPELWLDQYVVVLDAKTGKKKWEKPLDTHDGIVVFFLVYADSSIVIASSGKGAYHLYSLDDRNGNLNWHVTHPWPNDNHGGHMQHPAVTNKTVYLEPCGYDLKTGERVTENMGRHSGCATYAATSEALIYRGDSRRISMWDLKSGEVSSWYNLRPSCWLSVIPAGGMILAPEGGGGCSCGNWLETSLGFLPINKNVQ